MIAGFFCLFVSLVCFVFLGFHGVSRLGVGCVLFCFLGLLFYFQDGARKRDLAKII